MRRRQNTVSGVAPGATLCGPAPIAARDGWPRVLTCAIEATRGLIRPEDEEPEMAPARDLIEGWAVNASEPHHPLDPYNFFFCLPSL